MNSSSGTQRNTAAGLITAVVLLWALPGCSVHSAASTATPPKRVIGKTVSKAATYREKSIASITLAKMVVGSDATFTDIDDQGDDWVVIVACSNTRKLEHSNLTFGVIPRESMTPKILASAQVGDYNRLVSACK